MKKYKIAVAGTGYVGLSIATLLSHHNLYTGLLLCYEVCKVIRQGG